MAAVPLVLTGMMAVLAAISREETSGRPESEEPWEMIEKVGWIVVAMLALASGAAWG
jgi:hypothetical protein